MTARPDVDALAQALKKLQMRDSLGNPFAGLLSPDEAAAIVGRVRELEAELDKWATPEGRMAWAGLHETVKALRRRVRELEAALEQIRDAQPTKDSGFGIESAYVANQRRWALQKRAADALGADA